MRKKLVGAVLLALGCIALIVSVTYLTAPQRSFGASAKFRTQAFDATWRVDQGRDKILVNESRALSARKLLPHGAHSLLKVPAQMRHGDYLWNEQGVKAGDLNIWVDLRRQTISVFRNGHEIGTAIIVYGAEDKTSPEGVFPIIKKIRDYHSRSYDAPMPSSLFISNDGLAVHGSPMSARRASHGCIGLPVKFAEKLFDTAKVGDVVTIIRSNGPLDPYSMK